MKALNRPELLSDESLAKAIILNWFRCAEEEKENNIKNTNKINIEHVRGKKYNYNKILMPWLKAMKPVTIFRSDEFEQLISGSKKVPPMVSIAYFTDRQRIDHFNVNGNYKYIALLLEHFDTKSLQRTGLLACLLTDHFLARVLQRTNAKNLSEFLEEIHILLNAILKSIVDNRIPLTDFYIFTNKAIYPIEYFEVDFSPTLRVKTYLSGKDCSGVTKRVFDQVTQKITNHMEYEIISASKFADYRQLYA